MDSDKLTKPQRIIALTRISWTELIIGGGFVVILLLIAAMSAYMEQLKVVTEMKELFINVTERVGEFLDTRLVTSFVTLFFWGLVGLVLYSLLWALCVMFMDIRSNIVTSQYFVHPRSFHKSDFWLALFSRRVILLTAYTLIGVYIFLLFKSIPIIYASTSEIFELNIATLMERAFSSILALGSWLLGWHLIVVVRRLSLALTK